MVRRIIAGATTKLFLVRLDGIPDAAEAVFIVAVPEMRICGHVETRDAQLSRVADEVSLEKRLASHRGTTLKA
jgi:hypothetical protein